VKTLSFLSCQIDMRNRFRKIAVTLGLLLLLALALSVSLQLELPTPTGPYSVGRSILRWLDSARQEVQTEDTNDVREVMALIWYPAVEGTGTKVGYFPELSVVSNALRESGEVAPWEIFSLGFIRSQNNLDAEPMSGPFPVVIFSPGNGTNIEFYSSLASEIASHGYIVVGINHPYDVAAVQVSDGNIAHYDKDQWQLEVKTHQVYTAERIKVRTADVS
jgi:hypothetical protein